MDDNILVRWKADDDGWREGVLCCVAGDCPVLHPDNMLAEIRRGSFGNAVIWDRTRNERCIVALGKVRLIEPRCPKCGGEGVVDAINTKLFSDDSGQQWRCKVACECQSKP